MMFLAEETKTEGGQPPVPSKVLCTAVKGGVSVFVCELGRKGVE